LGEAVNRWQSKTTRLKKCNNYCISPDPVTDHVVQVALWPRTIMIDRHASSFSVAAVTTKVTKLASIPILYYFDAC
jgi:hypothetical protein